MRLTKHKRPTQAGMNMTPMIDIVFLLIIFFMTVTQVSEINKKRLNLPKNKGSQDQQPSKLIINVDPNGLIEISGETRTLTDVERLVADLIVAAGNEPRLVSVVIRSDRAAKSQTVNDVVKSLAGLRITQIKINVESE